MNSVWAPSSKAKALLLPQLHRQLADSSEQSGVIDPFPSIAQLGTFCLEWLEKNSKYQEVIELGRHAPLHLQTFLQVSLSPSLSVFLLTPLQSRPYLAWIQNLIDGRYVEAAENSALYCSGEMVDPKTQLIRSFSSSGETTRAHEAKPQSLLTTKTLLSVSKLCSWLEIKKEAESNGTSESKEPHHSSTSSRVHESWDTANTSLLTLRAQQLIQEKSSVLG
jgi:hypothetical protein